MTRAVLAAFALTVAVSPPAAAEPVRHADDRWEVDLSAEWARAGDELVWANAATGQRLVVRRIDGPGTAAWRARNAFFDGVEAGVKRTAANYKRIKRSTGKAGRVPTMDLWYRYDATDGTAVTVAMRYLFFRRYAVVLAVDTPTTAFRKHRRATRHVLRSFTPYFPPDED